MMFWQGKYDEVLETSGINNLLRVQLPTGAPTRAGSHAHNVDAADSAAPPLQTPQFL